MRHVRSSPDPDPNPPSVDKVPGRVRDLQDTLEFPRAQPSDLPAPRREPEPDVLAITGRDIRNGEGEPDKARPLHQCIFPTRGFARAARATRGAHQEVDPIPTRKTLLVREVAGDIYPQAEPKQRMGTCGRVSVASNGGGAMKTPFGPRPTGMMLTTAFAAVSTTETVLSPKFVT